MSSVLTDLVHCSQKQWDRPELSQGRFPASAGVRQERRFRRMFRSLRYRGLSTCPGLSFGLWRYLRQWQVAVLRSQVS